MDILEAFYYQFRIYPYQGRKVRSIRKEPKLYLVDWSEVPEPAARFENLLACHLLKYVQYLYEHEGYPDQRAIDHRPQYTRPLPGSSRSSIFSIRLCRFLIVAPPFPHAGISRNLSFG
jgi:hypothetical protein